MGLFNNRLQIVSTCLSRVCPFIFEVNPYGEQFAIEHLLTAKHMGTK